MTPTGRQGEGEEEEEDEEEEEEEEYEGGGGGGGGRGRGGGSRGRGGWGRRKRMSKGRPISIQNPSSDCLLRPASAHRPTRYQRSSSETSRGAWARQRW
eukprot:9503810-Pyramimonas_sp.AAC.1